MARIRSVKPEFWEDEAIGLLSRDARLLYIATWNMADDEGLLRWTASYVKANAFMYDDDIGIEDVTRLMAELSSRHLVLPYTAGKTRQSLGWIVQFGKHQKPNRPQPSKLPPPSIQNGDVLQAYVRRDHNTCHLCGAECSTEHDHRELWPSLDHVTPRSEGGSDYPTNIRLSHTSCNKGRGARPVESVSVPRSVSEAVNRSVTESVTDTLPMTVNRSPLEGRGGELERKGSSTPPSGAQTLIGEWIDSCRKRPPQPVVGQVAKLVGQMLEEGVDYDDVRHGLAAWAAKGMHPSTLPSVVNEVMNAAPRVATTTQRVQAGLALVDKYREAGA